jgi:hypothetical protein
MGGASCQTYFDMIAPMISDPNAANPCDAPEDAGIYDPSTATPKLLAHAPRLILILLAIPT